MSLTLLTRSNVVISTVVWQFWGSGWVPQVSALGVILILLRPSLSALCASRCRASARLVRRARRIGDLMEQWSDRCNVRTPSCMT